jgi:hypothetical protein
MIVIIVEKTIPSPAIVALLLPRTTATDTSELWTELAWCAILLSTVIPSTVIVTVSTTRSAVGALTTTTTRTTLCRACTNGLAMGLGNNLCRKVEPLPEVLNTLGCKRVIVPLP